MSNHFGKTIRDIRKRHGMSQQQFAAALKYRDKSAICHIEKGDMTMSSDKIALLIELFKVNANDLFVEPQDLSGNYVRRIRRYLGRQKIILNAGGGVVVQDGKVLLQRRSDNHQWGLPGGLLELNETYLDGAIREIKEETGLIVCPTSFLGIYHNYDMEWANGDTAHVIGALYVFEIAGGELRVDEESLELRFFGEDEIPSLFAEDHRAAIKDYFAGIRYPLFEENLPGEY